ncbi:cation:proton antiporter [Actinomadura fibrosa]|uniref:Cation:proton antiporter n=1 Tax=Actinomadura fibrosa TaxID=111802 RepID=A0ABW2XXY9_9ACTN|nr:cation:proton antiporter [Actinomadura fibrosa]
MAGLTGLLPVLAALIVVAQSGGRLARRLRQPAVVGEIVCGALLATVLASAGWAPPAPGTAEAEAAAQLGLAVYLCGLGAETGAGAGVLVPSARSGWPVLGAALVPAGLGALAALCLSGRHAPAGTAAFTVFMAAAMAVTAFPVLARILDDRALTRSPVARQALGTAIVIDAAAWAALAAASVLADAGRLRLWPMAAAALALVPAFALLRPWCRRHQAVLRSASAAPGVAAVVFASSAAGDWAGWHAVLGAFVAGIVLFPPPPDRPAEPNRALETLEPLVVLLLPVYFVCSARHMDVTRWDAALPAETTALVAVALAGKLGGGYLGARLGGRPRREARVFAVLMNTRGLTEIIFLAVGLRSGIIDTGVYTAMIIMSLLTTALTGPLLTAVLGRDRPPP